MNTRINDEECKHTPHCEAPQNFVYMNLYIKEIAYLPAPL